VSIENSLLQRFRLRKFHEMSLVWNRGCISVVRVVIAFTIQVEPGEDFMSDRAEPALETKEPQSQPPALVDFDQMRDYLSNHASSVGSSSAGRDFSSSLSFPPIGDVAKDSRAQRESGGSNEASKLLAQADSKPKLALAPGGELLVPPLEFAAAGAKAAAEAKDTNDKPGDKPLDVSKDGKIEISEKDFERIGPRAAKVLRDAGVEKITITKGKDGDTYEATLKKPLEIPQDPDVDGCRKLKIGTSFKADVKKNDDGSFTLNNIEGLKAESKILFKWQDATVNKIHLNQTPDGKSEITSTGSWKSFSRDNSRVKEGEVFKTAELLFGRMKDMTDAAIKSAGK